MCLLVGPRALGAAAAALCALKEIKKIKAAAEMEKLWKTGRFRMAKLAIFDPN